MALLQAKVRSLTDKHFEEMSNPSKYPYGNFGLKANREKMFIMGIMNIKHRRQHSQIKLTMDYTCMSNEQAKAVICFYRLIKTNYVSLTLYIGEMRMLSYLMTLITFVVVMSKMLT